MGPLGGGRYGGRRQLGGGGFDTLKKFAIPIMHGLKSKLFSAAKGVAMAAKEAGGATLRKIAQEVPSMAVDGVKKILEKGTDHFIKKTVGVASKRPAPSASPTTIASTRKSRKSQPKAKKRRKHKRSRVDEMLGDDSY